MADLQHDPVKAMRRQIHLLWAVVLVLILGLLTTAFQGKFTRSAAVAHSASSTRTLTLISPTTGNRLVISGDGFQLLNKEGDSLVELTGSPGVPTLTLNEWRESSADMWSVLAAGTLQKSHPLHLGRKLLLKPAEVTVEDGIYGSNGSANLKFDSSDGPELFLDGMHTSELVGPDGFSVSNHCSIAGPPVNSQTTCYQTHASLSPLLGLSLETCQEYNGLPLSKKDKNKGCESLDALTQPFDGQGANISLSEDGQVRLIFGHALLTSEHLGGEERTPLSQITLFDKSGRVVWKKPEN